MSTLAAIAQDLRDRLPVTHRCHIQADPRGVPQCGIVQASPDRAALEVRALLEIHGQELTMELRPGALRAALFLQKEVRSKSLDPGTVRRYDLTHPASLDRLDADLRAAGIPLALPTCT